MYKSFPNRSYVKVGEIMKGRKVNKERVTLLLGGTMFGHKFKPLLIGKSKMPHALRKHNLANLPVYYTNNKSAWMTEFLFRNWFLDQLLPELEELLGKDFTCELLLDNCSAHPKAVESFDHRVFVSFLPPNVTALIQPMDQGVINTFKSCYKRLLTKDLADFVLKSQNNNNTITTSTTSTPHTREKSPMDEFIKQYDIYKAIINIGKAWAMVDPSTITKSFNKSIDIPLLVKTYQDRIENSSEDFSGFIDKNQLLTYKSPMTENLIYIRNVLNSLEISDGPLTIEDVEHDVTADPVNNPNVPSLLTELAFDELNINDGEGEGTSVVPVNYVSKYQSLICKISLIQQEAEELNDDEILKNIKILSNSITCKLIDKTDSMRSAKISSYFKPNEKSTEHTEKDL